MDGTWYNRSSTRFTLLYTDIIGFGKGPQDWLKTNRFPKKLPSDAFVFWIHQGYEFLFFCCSEGDDPTVNYYNEIEHDRDFAWNRYESYSEFLVREIIGHAQILEDITGISNHSRNFYPHLVPVHPRDYDVELKLLDNFVTQFEGEVGNTYPERNGTIRFVSEEAICISCRRAIQLFHNMFPNLEIDIATPEE